MTPPEKTIEAQTAGEIKTLAKAVFDGAKTQKITWTYG
jgi:hypothetical protein